MSSEGLFKRGADAVYRAQVGVMGLVRFAYRARGADWLRLRQAKRLLQSPIVIGGCGRSGTTLLIGLMDGHKSIQSIPAESIGFSPGAYGDNPTFGRAPHMNTLYRHVLAMDIAPATRRICEKTPRNVQYFAAILRYFGSRVRIINMVRDGRDVVLSQHPSRPGPYVAPERWIADVSAGLEFDDHPQVLTVRYEDLVTHTEDSMKRICAFIDEPWDAGILDYENRESLSKTESASFGANARRRKPEASSVGKWKNADSEWVQALLRDARALGLLRHYGYLEEADSTE